MTRKNGCFDYDMPGKSEIVVQDGYFFEHAKDLKMPKYVALHYRMSTGCKYAEHGYAKNDTGCNGCKNNS